MKRDIRKKILLFSLINLIIGVVMFALTFFVFHFVTDSGITFIYHKQAEKPFVAFMMGIFAVLCLFTSMISFIATNIFFKKEKTNE